jgi:hypothetical protein
LTTVIFKHYHYVMHLVFHKIMTCVRFHTVSPCYAAYYGIVNAGYEALQKGDMSLLNISKAFRSREFSAVRRRSLLRLVGSSLSVVVLALLGLALRNNSLTTASNASSTPPISSAGQADGTTPSTSSNVSQDSLVPDQTNQSQADGSGATSVSVTTTSSNSTDGDGTSTNAVSIDGQTVAPPSNGGTTTVITSPDGTTVNVAKSTDQSDSDTNGYNFSSDNISSFSHSDNDSYTSREVY